MIMWRPRECSHVQAKERGLARNQTHWHLGLPASRTGGKKFLLSHPVYAALLWRSQKTVTVCCHGIPYLSLEFCRKGLGEQRCWQQQWREGGGMTVGCMYLLWERTENITDGGRTGELFYWESREWCVLEITWVLQRKTNMGRASWHGVFAYC